MSKQELEEHNAYLRKELGKAWRERLELRIKLAEQEKEPRP